MNFTIKHCVSVIVKQSISLVEEKKNKQIEKPKCLSIVKLLRIVAVFITNLLTSTLVLLPLDW